MATQKITDLTALAAADATNNDQICIVDVDDTTMASSGTNKKMGLRELGNFLGSGGAAQWCVTGGFYQSSTSFVYWPSSSASTSESAAIGYLTICPVPVACRLVDVTIWVQSGGTRSQSITAFNQAISGPGANLGSITATLTAGQTTTFTYNTSAFDYAQGDEFALGWTPTTAPLGVSFTARFELT